LPTPPAPISVTRRALVLPGGLADEEGPHLLYLRGAAHEAGQSQWQIMPWHGELRRGGWCRWWCCGCRGCGEAASQDIVIEACAGWIGGDIEFAAQGLAQLPILAQRLVSLATQGEEAHQSGVGLLMGRIDDEGLVERSDRRRRVPLRLVQARTGEAQLLDQIAQRLALPGRPVFVAVIGQQIAGVERQRSQV
jgi:hypothetical protein